MRSARAAAGILVVFLIASALVRGVLHVGIGLASLFAYSDLPWWILVPAAIALLAGFVFLLRRNTNRRSI